MFRFNNKDIRMTQLTWRRSAVFIVNFEHISHLILFLLVTISKQLFAGLVLFSVVFFIEGEDQPQKFLFSHHCITFLWFWECSEAAGRIFFTKEVFFKILQNLQKTTCSAVFLNKVRLATLINKDSGNGVFLWTFQNF